MSTRPDSVTVDLELRLVVPGSQSLPVRADFSYDHADPYAVRVAFHTGGAGSDIVEWTFARSLLTDGVTHPVGEGDVQVWPSHSAGRPVVCISLSSPSGRALFEATLTQLVSFSPGPNAGGRRATKAAPVAAEQELRLFCGREPPIWPRPEK